MEDRGLRIYGIFTAFESNTENTHNAKPLIFCKNWVKKHCLKLVCAGDIVFLIQETSSATFSAVDWIYDSSPFQLSSVASVLEYGCIMAPVFNTIEEKKNPVC